MVGQTIKKGRYEGVHLWWVGFKLSSKERYEGVH